MHSARDTDGRNVAFSFYFCVRREVSVFILGVQKNSARISCRRRFIMWYDLYVVWLYNVQGRCAVNHFIFCAVFCFRVHRKSCHVILLYRSQLYRLLFCFGLGTGYVFKNRLSEFKFMKEQVFI